MTVILTSQRLIRNESYPEIREALDVRQGNLLRQAGLLQVPVPVDADLELFFAQLEPAGLILSGGNDLGSLAPGDPLSRRRDEFENRLVDHAIDLGIPILGICRGLQFLATRFGEELVPAAGHVATRHEVTTTRDTMMRDVYGTTVEVNSYHGFCLTTLTSDELVMTAQANEDQTVEAFRHRTLPIHAMMWHPEREEPPLRTDLALLTRIFTRTESGESQRA